MYEYNNIETLKDDMVKIVVFGKNPNENTYKDAVACPGLRRYCYEGISIQGALNRVPQALQYLSRVLSALSSAALQREIDERVWYVLHPKKDLTQDEQNEISRLKYRIYILEQADYLDAKSKDEINDLIEKIREIRGVYPGRGW